MVSLSTLLLIACGSGGPLSTLETSYPAGIAWGPILAHASPTSMTITWSSTANSAAEVEFGLDETYGTTISEEGVRRDHSVRIDALLPSTTYHYRLSLEGEVVGGDHAFRTPPDASDAPVRFAVLGDSGTGHEPEGRIVGLLSTLAPDFVLHVGDAAYDSGSSSEVHARFLAPFARLMDHVPLYLALGNHDADTRGGEPLLKALSLPTNSADGSEHFYSFDWGALHVVALDSNRSLGLGSPQLAWLHADLSASSAPWTIVFFHHPVYSSSTHGEREDLQASLAPLLEVHGVDLVFSGHDHVYERTFPMVADTPIDVLEPDYVDAPGPIYVVTGGGGKDLYPSGWREWTAYSESSFHVTCVEADASSLVLRAVRLDGSEMDRMTLRTSVSR
jgi:3',5'-cyclic AMP phosphodiesterase CpdA